MGRKVRGGVGFWIGFESTAHRACAGILDMKFQRSIGWESWAAKVPGLGNEKHVITRQED